MSEETTTEQLAEIEGQAAEPATGYTPPEGWRLLAVGELVMLDDQWVRQDGSVWRSMGTEGPVSEGARYIRRIEPKPVWVCEGRWRTRGGDIKNIRACEPLKGAYYVWPWTDGFMTFQDNGRHQGSQDSPNDLVEYLGPIEEQPQPQPKPQPETQQNGLVRDVTHQLQESGVLDLAKAEEQIEELRKEVHYVQRLLGESRQRVTQLEELVASLRTINDAQEKTVRLAGQENTDLQHRLNVVSAELVEQFETVRKLRIELDAAQQVPTDSPELRQLRLDLAEVTQERDTYRHAHERVLSDLETIRETTKAETVEAIAEWLQPIKGAIDAADNQDELARAGFFAIDTIRHLAAIMRSLTGLTPED